MVVGLFVVVFEVGVDIEQAVDNNKLAVVCSGMGNIVIVDLQAPVAVEVVAALVAA